MDQLCLIEMRDLVFGRLAVEESLDVSEGRSRMAFEVAAYIDEKDKLSWNDGWRVCIHI